MILNLLSETETKDFIVHQTFKFKTNAPTFSIELTVKEQINGFYPHVGLSAKKGLMLLYKTKDSENWFNVDAFTSRHNTNVNMTHLVKKGEEYEILVYGPILSKLTELKINLPKGSTGTVMNDYSDFEILVAGGLYSYGIGCTTTSLMFSNILGRKTNSKVDNISFKDNKFLKKTYELLKDEENFSDYTIGILEVDNFAQDEKYIEKYLKKTIDLMKSYCKQVICWYSTSDNLINNKEKVLEVLNEYDSSENINFIDLSFTFNDENRDICTYSNKFINDTGNIMIFKKMEDIVIETVMAEIMESL